MYVIVRILDAGSKMLLAHSRSLALSLAITSHLSLWFPSCPTGCYIDLVIPQPLMLRIYHSLLQRVAKHTIPLTKEPLISSNNDAISSSIHIACLKILYGHSIKTLSGISKYLQPRPAPWLSQDRFTHQGLCNRIFIDLIKPYKPLAKKKHVHLKPKPEPWL